MIKVLQFNHICDFMLNLKISIDTGTVDLKIIQSTEQV